MGTPAACAYATITYGHFENSNILPNFRQNLMYCTSTIFSVSGYHLWATTKQIGRDSPQS
jgi:hypothetical protein